jgi:hypothetical protein
MRRTIRRFAVWLRARTDRWVVNPDAYKALDAGDLGTARRILIAAEKAWPGDPEVSHLATIFHFTANERRAL